MKISSLLHLAAAAAAAAAVLARTTEAAADFTLALSTENVHWGYFSKTLKPAVTVPSGATIQVEMATHHACDDYDKMIKGDAAMESLFAFGSKGGEFPRGATGQGDGVHILTGPIYVENAEPGDILKVEIVSLTPRKNSAGKSYGSNAAAWWGFQARFPLAAAGADGTTKFTAGSKTNTPGKNDEVVTIYEVTDQYAIPVYQFEWPNKLTDPNGTVHDTIDFPGLCIPHDNHCDTVVSSAVTDNGWKKEGSITYYDDPYQVRIPINFHVGCMGLAPASHDFVDSIPPMVTGGNLDNKRIGVGTTMYYPVQVTGGLLSMGDAHAAQGDSELDGTGIETSLTGTFKVTVIKKADFTPAQAVLDFPLGETSKEWIVHGFTETDYLTTYNSNPAEIFKYSTVDGAMKNAYLQTRKFLMAMYNLTEAEAWSFITQGIDFGITQIVDGNWGVHAVIPKVVFEGFDNDPVQATSRSTPTGRKWRELQGDYKIELNSANVHWGYFSKTLAPVLTVPSGSTVVVEMATHHACDDWDKMIKGDAGMTDVFTWSSTKKIEDFRGATGGGDGVHILTGPIYVEGAQPGDLIKVEILDLQPRLNPDGKSFGSNAAAWWGYQARAPLADGSVYHSGSFTGTPGDNDEIVTIYELVKTASGSYATPSYQFRWPIVTDPMNTTRDYIAYPGTCVPHDPHGSTTPSSDVANMGWTKKGEITYFDDVFKAKIPVHYHIGCMGLAPESHDFVDSIPPMPSGGNLDNRRIGIGTTMYYPVEVPGGLLSMGDAHTAQGDSELDGTGIETSITGKFKLSVIKKADFTKAQASLDFPLGETATEWLVHGFTETDYLEKYKSDPASIYDASNLDKATANAFLQTRKFLMAQYGLTEYEAWTYITQGVDFGVTQVVDGNWGVHTVIPKAVFESVQQPEPKCSKKSDPSAAAARSMTIGPMTALVLSVISWFVFVV